MAEIHLSISNCNFPPLLSEWKGTVDFYPGIMQPGSHFNPPESFLVSLTPIHGHSLPHESLDTYLCSQMNRTEAW